MLTIFLMNISNCQYPENRFIIGIWFKKVADVKPQLQAGETKRGASEIGQITVHMGCGLFLGLPHQSANLIDLYTKYTKAIVESHRTYQSFGLKSHHQSQLQDPKVFPTSSHAPFSPQKNRGCLRQGRAWSSWPRSTPRANSDFGLSCQRSSSHSAQGIDGEAMVRCRRC